MDEPMPPAPPVMKAFLSLSPFIVTFISRVISLPRRRCRRVDDH
jgi:hypothetical protein